jgi:hypothetical protein
MPIRNDLKGGLVALSAVALASAIASPALAQAQKPHQALLGVRLYDTYASVLKKFGPPTEVRGGGETGAPDSPNKGQGGLAAAPGGGMPGMMRGGGMASMMGGPPGGMMGGGPPGGAAMAAMMRGSMGGRPQGAGGGMPQGVGGMPGMMRGGGGLPGFSGRRGGDDGDGAPGAGGGMAGMMRGAGGGAAGASQGSAFESSGGFVWSFLDPKAEIARDFYFNKDGRVEIISEVGRARNSVTSKGVAIGSLLADVYRAYGWPDTTGAIHNGEMTVMSYQQKNHLQVLLVKGRVVGLVITLRENQKINLTSPGGGAGGRGGGMASMMGGAGGGGGAPIGKMAGLGRPGAVGAGGGGGGAGGKSEE